MNNRRRRIVALGAGAIVASFASFAQQKGKVWRVGFLAPRRPVSLDTDIYAAFPQGMRELGYIEGKNLVIEWRFADGKYEALEGLAAELVHLKVDAIVTAGSQATSAAQKATSTIPIVIGNAGDPVGSGFVKSLARPGGNITGLSNLTGDVSSKFLELLLGTAPKLSRVAVLSNPTNSSHATILQSVQRAAQSTGVKLLSVEAQTPKEIENAFFRMVQEKTGAVIVALDVSFIQQRRQIAELAIKNRLPSISGFREYVEAGGLMSYGQDLAESYRRAATYVDKILKGAKPGDLPVEQATKFELFINRKTARALGLNISQSLLISADQVIE